MAFRFSLLAIEREPRVATSLDGDFISHGHGHNCVQAGVSLLYTYQIVAAPCSGDVRTKEGPGVSGSAPSQDHTHSWELQWRRYLTFMAVKHGCAVSWAR